MHVYLFAHKSLRRGEKGTPSHAKSCDCVSASGILPKGGEPGVGWKKKFSVEGEGHTGAEP